MEGDAFDVLDATQKLVEGDVALLETGYLCADAVVGYRAVDDVVVVERQALRLGAVVVDEMRPFLGVFLEALVAELLEERFIEVIDVDNGRRVFKLGTKLSHLQGLLFVGRKVEGPAKVFIWLGLAKVDLLNIDCGAVIEPHSLPPFLWQ